MNRLALLLLAIALLFMIGCGAEESDKQTTSKKTGYASPQTAFEAFQAAIQRKDWKGAAGCMTSDCQTLFAMGMTMGANSWAASSSGKSTKKADLERLFAKHGLERDPDADEEALNQALSQVKDKPAFIAELLDWLVKVAANGPKESDLESILIAAWGRDQLGDVRVDGDTATPMLTPTDMKFTFKKVDGGWLLQLSRDHFGLPTETTRYLGNKTSDMNDMRSLVALLTIQSKVPMKDGRVDVYALVGDIGPENFSVFKSERFGVGPTKEQIEKRDYSDFPYGRFSGKVEMGKMVPLLWDKKPDKQGGRVVGFNGGAVKWLPEAKVQELLKQYNQTQSKPANK